RPSPAWPRPAPPAAPVTPVYGSSSTTGRGAVRHESYVGGLGAADSRSPPRSSRCPANSTPGTRARRRRQPPGTPRRVRPNKRSRDLPKPLVDLLLQHRYGRDGDADDQSGEDNPFQGAGAPVLAQAV